MIPISKTFLQLGFQLIREIVWGPFTKKYANKRVQFREMQYFDPMVQIIIFNSWKYIRTLGLCFCFTHQYRSFHTWVWKRSLTNEQKLKQCQITNACFCNVVYINSAFQKSHSFFLNFLPPCTLWCNQLSIF